jgi:hypothetical protein
MGRSLEPVAFPLDASTLWGSYKATEKSGQTMCNSTLILLENRVNGFVRTAEFRTIAER